MRTLGRAGEGAPMATSASVWRTDRCSATTRRQASTRLPASSRPSKCSGVSLRDLVRANRIQDGVGEFEKADQVGDRRPIKTETARQLFLGDTVAGQVFAERGGLIDGIQVFALKVLDHRDLEDALIVEYENPSRQFMQLSFDTCPQPPFTGDELIAIADRPDQNRLEHAVLAQRIGQRRDFLGIELPARLIGVSVNLIDGDLDQVARVKRSPFKSPFLAAEQCFESAPQASLIHGR